MTDLGKVTQGKGGQTLTVPDRFEGKGSLTLKARAGMLKGEASVPLIPTWDTGWAANLILWGAIGGGIGAVCGYILGFVLGWVLPQSPAAGRAGR